MAHHRHRSIVALSTSRGQVQFYAIIYVHCRAVSQDKNNISNSYTCAHAQVRQFPETGRTAAANGQIPGSTNGNSEKLVMGVLDMLWRGS